MAARTPYRRSVTRAEMSSLISVLAKAGILPKQSTVTIRESNRIARKPRR